MRATPSQGRPAAGGIEWHIARMAKDRDPLADITAADSQGLLTNFLAEEREGGWQAFWRLGSWAGCAVGALVVAFLAVHNASGQYREQFASADTARQAQQMQWIANEGQSEARRLAAAITTLNADRDRLYARVTVLEQGLDSVTGSIARPAPPPSLVLSSATQSMTAPPMITAPATAPAPASEPPQATPAPEAAAPHAHAVAAKDAQPSSTVYAPPDPAAPRLVEIPQAVPPQPEKVAAKPVEALLEKVTAKPVEALAPEKVAARPVETPSPALAAAAQSPQPQKAASMAVAALPEAKPAEAAGHASEVAVQRTEFGVDLGGANSVEGLRALWQGLATAKGSPVASLRPIIAIRERRNGLGLQLRLVAGPLGDAAAAARICAALAEGNRLCETTVFDGQRLAMRAADEQAPVARPHRRAPVVRQVKREETPPPPQPAVAAPAPAAPASPAPAPSAAPSMSGLFRSR